MTSPTPAFTPDDSRLTAFALGELDGQERAEFEQFLESSEEAREALTEIQETIGLLRDELATEPTPSLTDEQRAAVTAEASGEHPALAPATEATPPGTNGRRSWIGLVSALTAMVAVVCLVPLLQQDPMESVEFDSGETTELSSIEIQSVAMGQASGGLGSGYNDDADEGDGEVIEYVKAGGKDTPATQDEYRRELSEALASRGTGDSQVAPTVGDKPSESYDFDSTRPQDGPALPAKFGDVAENEEADNSPASARGLLGGAGRRREAAGERGQAVDDVSKTKPRIANPLLPGDGQPYAGTIPAQPGPGSEARNEAGGKRDGQLGLTQKLASPGEATPSPNTATAVRPTEPSRAAEQGKVKNPAGQSGGGNASNVNGAVTGGLVSDRADRGGDKSQPNPTAGKPQTAPAQLTASISPVPASPEPKDGGRPQAAKEVFGGSGGKQPVAGQGIGGGGFGNRGNGEGQPQAEGDSATEEAATPGLTLAKNDARQKNLSPQEEAYLKKASEFYSAFGRISSRKTASPELRYGTRLPRPQSYNEAYDQINENKFIQVEELNPETRKSTFSIDVDTASYANVRRFLDQGQFPPKNAVRVEELINYFSYDYPQPQGDDPFSVNIEVNICPWQPQHRLARIGLQAKNLDDRVRPPTNLVFLIDTSGSMRAENKLPLVRASMNMLVSELTEDDQVSIVTYSSTADLRLATTSGAKKSAINQVIDSLQAGGSTNGAGGIQLAYDTAVRKFIDGGSNRVIICTDGDFNVGISDDDKLVEMIQEKAASGVFLSVFGFGMGNLKDSKLEKLADKGNGQYGYIDSQGEAKKVFRDDVLGTLYTVAKDVKARVEFNPEKVGAYRLIGYENRLMAARDFDDDTKDAGEIGAGHTVTALYEIIPRSVLIDQSGVGELKYGRRTGKEDGPERGTKTPEREELFELELKYKKPDEESSEAATKYPVRDISIGETVAPSQDFVWAATVASFGMNLRESQYRGDFSFREVLVLAQRATGDDENGRRKDFVNLITKAARLAGQGGELEPPAEVKGSSTPPTELDATAARVKASVDGKYRRLLKKIEVPDDFRRFSAVHNYGFWDGTEYAGHRDLLPGFWVYVYPNWYIWAQDTTPTEASDPQEPADPPGKSSDPPPEEKPTEAIPSDKPAESPEAKPDTEDTDPAG